MSSSARWPRTASTAAYQGSDKTFQFNGRGELRISNFYVAKAGKLVRSCGDCTGNGGPRRIFINNVITRDEPTIAGINSNFGDVATIRNLTLNNSGTTKTKICQVYKGVVKRQGRLSPLFHSDQRTNGIFCEIWTCATWAMRRSS